MKSRDFVEFYLHARHLHDQVVGNAFKECGRLLAGWFSSVAALLHRQTARAASMIYLRAHAHGAKC